MFSFVYYRSMHYFPTMPKILRTYEHRYCEAATCHVTDSGKVNDSKRQHISSCGYKKFSIVSTQYKHVTRSQSLSL